MKQMSFMEALQSRIDQRSNEIAYEELCKDKTTLAALRQDQVFDKRLLGYIIDLHRHLKILHKVANEKWRTDGLLLINADEKDKQCL